MRLIDTNVFIYAVGRPHEYKDVCIRVLDEVGAGRIEANIDVELLQEVLYYLGRRGRWDDAIAMFDRIVTAFPAPFPIGINEATRARDILAGGARVEARDAIHAAVVLEHRLEGIISTDRGFDAITGLTRFDPRALTP